MRILRLASAVLLAFATLGLGSLAAYAAEPATPVDSSRTIGDDSPYGAFLFHNDNGWHFRTHGIPGHQLYGTYREQWDHPRRRRGA